MKHLIIVGAGGWGREVSWLAKSCIGYGTEFDIKGFLDDRTDALDGLGNYPPILGSVQTYKQQADDVFTIALGSPSAKRKYAETMMDKGAEFINLIHKEAAIHPSAVIGKGCIFDIRSIVSVNCTIGDFVTLQRDTNIGHDSVIGNYCMLNSFSCLGGHAQIGECTEIGTHAVVLPDVQVGKDSKVGAGSVAIRNVKDDTTVFGVPAMKVEF